MVRVSGANKIYIASAAPEVRYPNVYGIDMPTSSELIAHGRNAAGGKEQRIARQEGRNHQAGFAEYNQKQDDVNPNAVLQG